MSLFEGYSVFSGVQEALVQWYGHNAVAFFLTTPILGITYYFLPKAAERPVHSYRLSVVHFWSLVFMFIYGLGRTISCTPRSTATRRLYLQICSPTSTPSSRSLLW